MINTNDYSEQAVMTGEVVRKIRKSVGLSQTQLAVAANMRVHVIVDIEKGRFKLTVYHLSLLADALGCTLDDLAPAEYRDTLGKAKIYMLPIEQLPTIGQKIRKKRIRAGLSAEQLSKKMSFSRAMITKMERGETPIQQKFKDEFCRVFGLDKRFFEVGKDK